MRSYSLHLVSTWVLAMVVAGHPALARAADDASSAAAEAAVKGDDAKAPRTVLVADLEANNVDAKTVDTIGSLVAGEVGAQPGLSVIAGSDLRRMLELEAEKQEAGCEADASCLAEVAGAMGAELFVSGQVGKLSSRIIITLTLIDTKSATAVGRSTVVVDDVGTLPEVLKQKIPELVSGVVDVPTSATGNSAPKVSGAPSAEAAPESSGGTFLSAAGYGVLGVGGVVLAGGLASAAVGAYFTTMVLLTQNAYAQAQAWDKAAQPQESEAIDDLTDARSAYSAAIDENNVYAPWLYGIGGAAVAGGLVLAGSGSGLLIFAGGDAE